eukprot:366315-Chlamydomonas_euryale.AAC.2
MQVKNGGEIGLCVKACRRSGWVAARSVQRWERKSKGRGGNGRGMQGRHSMGHAGAARMLVDDFIIEVLECGSPSRKRKAEACMPLDKTSSQPTRDGVR